MDFKQDVQKIRRFQLEESPVAVQLTIHIQNMIVQYGPNVIREFKATLNVLDESDLALDSNFRINQLITHYGFETMKQWFGDIYGWTYQKAS